MAELRVTRPAEGSQQVAGVAADGRGRQQEHQPPPDEQRRRRAEAAAELAVVLADDRSSLTAVYEEGADGSPLIRIVDRERGETVAVLTPDELRALAGDIGLPPGMLVQTAT